MNFVAESMKGPKVVSSGSFLINSGRLEDAIASVEESLGCRLDPVTDPSVIYYLEHSQEEYVRLGDTLYQKIGDGKTSIVIPTTVRIHTAENDDVVDLQVVTKGLQPLVTKLESLLNATLKHMATPKPGVLIPVPFVSVDMPFGNTQWYQIVKATASAQLDIGDALAVWERVFIRMDNSRPDSMSQEDNTIREYWETHRHEVGIAQMREDVAAMAPALAEAFRTLQDVWDDENDINLLRAHAFDLEFVPEILDWMVLNDFDPIVALVKKDCLDAAKVVYPRVKAYVVEIEVPEGVNLNLHSLLTTVLGQHIQGVEVVEVIEKEQ